MAERGGLVRRRALLPAMKLLPLSPALFLALCLHSGAQEDFTKQLDKILRHPGEYSQICDAMPWPKGAPIPAFRSIMHGEAGISEKNMALLKKNRDAVVRALKARLKAIDPVKPAKEQQPDPSIPKDQWDVTPVGVDPAVFSDLMLLIVEELSAVEVFPELVAFEEKYLAALAKAEADTKAPLPTADGADGAGVHEQMSEEELAAQEKEDPDKERTPEVEAAQERKWKLFSAKMAHRDILATLVRVMRKVGYDPMLQSSIEKEYGRMLKEKWAKDETYSKYTSRESIPEEERESIKWDPIHKVAYPVWTPLEFPYSPEVRTQIVDLAKKCGAEKAKK
jgi:hypothetical protein